MLNRASFNIAIWEWDLGEFSKTNHQASARFPSSSSYSSSVPNVEGRILRLYRVSRLDMGVYMCIAKNGIPPAVSKTIRLGIDCEKRRLPIRIPLL